MIPVLALSIAVIAMVIAGSCYWHLLSTPGRSAADPDKETPPTGFRPLAHSCAACGERITDDDQVMIRGEQIMHTRCVWNRRRTIRPGV